MAQPVISYPGAKWKFYNDMREYFPDDMEVFIEPFFGGGSVSLSVADDQSSSWCGQLCLNHCVAISTTASGFVLIPCHRLQVRTFGIGHNQ